MHTMKMVLVVVLSAAPVACAEAIAPTDNRPPHRAGDVQIVSIWRTADDQARGIKLSADTTAHPAGIRSIGVDALSYRPLAPAELQRLGEVLARYETAASNMLEWGRAGRSTDPLHRGALPKFRTVTSTDAHGNEIRVVTVQRSDGGRLGASLLFRNDSLQAVIQMMRPARNARISGLRVFRFGPDGTPSGVSEIRTGGLPTVMQHRRDTVTTASKKLQRTQS